MNATEQKSFEMLAWVTTRRIILSNQHRALQDTIIGTTERLNKALQSRQQKEVAETEAHLQLLYTALDRIEHELHQLQRLHVCFDVI